MNSTKYLEYIGVYLGHWSNKHPGGIVLQDNAPCHCFRFTTSILQA